MTTRARQAPAARVFGGLCALLATFATVVISERLTVDPSVGVTLNRVENAAAVLIPAVVLHFAIVFAAEGPRSRSQSVALAGSYLASAAMAVVAVAAPTQAWELTPPHFSLPGIPAEVFGWTWIAARLAMLGLAGFWIARSLRQSGLDRARAQQLTAALATILVGASGGALRIISGAVPSDPWIGVMLIAAALVMAAYSVFAQGVFLAPTVAGGAFLYSVVIGLGLVVFVGVVMILDPIVRRILAVELPLVVAFGVVIAAALFDPMAERVRRLVRRADYAGSADRLQRALDEDLLTAQEPRQAIEPALARLVRTFRLRGAALTDADGSTVAVVGSDPRDDPGALPLRLGQGDPATALGTVVFGPKRSHLPFTVQEMSLLHEGGVFLGELVDLGAHHHRQATALADLSRHQASVGSRGLQLSRALGEASAATASGLRVSALGPLRVERDGALIARWGGEKAGSRQAEAIFAFLFDRGERGVAKDEIIELVWPDVDLERADLAFHRTVGGLRTTLEPGRRGQGRGEAIVFHHDRYRLQPDLVTASDVADLEVELAAAGGAPDLLARLNHLERARALFRGEYLDDCPYYGDSAEVEEHRGLWRGRWVDLLLSLGELHEARGDRPAAAACFRQARQAAGESLPTAEAALARLGSPI